jgi:putative PIN family toxin of toxin-antitoxin system
LIADDEIRPYATDAVLLEYERVFEYERLKRLDRRRVANVLRLIKAAVIKVKSGGRLKLSPDEKDNRIYECAAAAKAHYIVTENTQDFPRGYRYTKIVNARQLLALWAKSEGKK